MSDKVVGEIIGKAWESGNLKVRKVISTLTGLTGSGKTCLLSSLFYTLPPHLYTSTGIVFHQGLLLPNDSVSVGPWKLFSHTDISPPILSSPSSTVHSELQLLPKDPSGSKKEISLKLVYMIDTGGQPELMEIMPSIIHNPNLAVVVLNLMYGLDDHPPVSFHVKGVAYRQKVPSRYTARHILNKIVATLLAKRFSRKKKSNLFRLLVVATHQDAVGDLEAQVSSLNQELRTLLLPSCKDELICYSSDQIAFVVKLKNPDGNDEKILQLIRSKVSTSSFRMVIEMPGSILMYEQDLLKYAAEVKRGILSLGECMHVGKRLNMENEVVIAALVFLPRCNTFLYFRKVFPNLIFVKPQIPLGVVNAVLLLSYKISDGSFHGLPTKFSSYVKNGIITEELLSHDEFATCFVSGLYESRDAIKLLCHIFTLAPLQKHAKETEYLMMCLLPTIPDEVLPHHVPSSPDMTPLVVKFTGDCVPLGCFGSTISCLVSKYEWIISRSECLAHNIASLSCPPRLHKVVLVDSFDHIEVYVGVDEDVSELLPKVRKDILGAIREVLDIMHLTDIDALPAVLCPCKKVSQSHSASLIEVKSEKLLYCSKTKLTQGTAHDKHVKWFGDNPLESGKFMCFICLSK